MKGECYENTHDNFDRYLWLAELALAGIHSPCRNLTGEILRIEESYWIQGPEGEETHVKVTRDAKMAEIPKVGAKP